MKIVRNSLIVGFLLSLMALLVIPAAAATVTRTWTATEDQVNSTYRVTNPARRAISDVSVDLQPGQVVVSSTHTYPRNIAYSVVTTLVPTVSNGRVTWSVTSVLVDGQALPADVQQQINDSIASSWRNFLKGKYSGRVVSIDITDTDVTVTTQSLR